MKLIEFLRLTRKIVILLIIIPLMTAGATYFLTKNAEREFTNSAMIYTGLSTAFNIESTGESRKDQFVVNNSFENILNTIRSRETIHEVSFKLLSEILTLKKKADGKHVNPKTFEKLNDWIPANIRKNIVVANNPQATYQNLQLAYENEHPKRIREFFNDPKSPFGLRNLGEIMAVRKGSRHMIDISYALRDKGLYGLQPLEGKTFVGNRIAEHLRKSGASVLLIQPGDIENTLFEQNKLTYPQTKYLSELKDISELISSWIDPNDYDYCLLELPSLLSGNVLTQILKNANISILTVAATRSWKKADRKAVQFLQNYNLPIEILVNGVAWESLENQVSEKEMPKWKISLKRLFRPEFNKKDLFNTSMA